MRRGERPVGGRLGLDLGEKGQRLNGRPENTPTILFNVRRKRHHSKGSFSRLPASLSISLESFQIRDLDLLNIKTSQGTRALCVLRRLSSTRLRSFPPLSLSREYSSTKGQSPMLTRPQRRNPTKGQSPRPMIAFCRDAARARMVVRAARSRGLRSVRKAAASSSEIASTRSTSGWP